MDEKTQVFVNSTHQTLSREVDTFRQRLADVLAACDAAAAQELLAQFKANILASVQAIDDEAQRLLALRSSPAPSEITPGTGKLTPELLAWARQQFSEEEIVAGLRELRETGGRELGDFIHELEQAAGPDE